MLKSKAIKELFKYFFSFLLGAMLVFLFAFNKEKVSSKSSFEFGDVKFSIEDVKVTIEDANALEKPINFDQVLKVSKDNYDFIQLFKDPSGKVFSFSITDGENMLVLSHFETGRISDFGVYGNKVHDNKRMPVFYITASDKPGIWQKATYMPNSKAIFKNGKLISYKPNGEFYDDIDFDGQFDAKHFRDENEFIRSESIFVDGEWVRIGKTDRDGKMLKIGHYNLKQLEAVTSNGKDVIYYDFEFGKGWKKRSDENAN